MSSRCHLTVIGLVIYARPTNSYFTVTIGSGHAPGSVLTTNWPPEKLELPKT